MPLPEEVINRLSEERAPTEGWSAGLLGFAIAVFLLVVGLYAGIAFAYEPYVGNRVSATADQLSRLSQSIDVNQETSLVALYSQIVHVRALLGNRTLFSPALAWLSKNTEANVYYSSLSFSSGNQIALTMFARSESDIDQQLAIFEADPDVLGVNVSNISLANVSGYLQASVVVMVRPSLLRAGKIIQ